jgi:hypothetical protein
VTAITPGIWHSELVVIDAAEADVDRNRNTCVRDRVVWMGGGKEELPIATEEPMKGFLREREGGVIDVGLSGPSVVSSGEEKAREGRTCMLHPARGSSFDGGSLVS